MKITRLETIVIGDLMDQIDPDKGAIEPIACIRVHTDEGLPVCPKSSEFRRVWCRRPWAMPTPISGVC